jgi:hypothetical protein
MRVAYVQRGRDRVVSGEGAGTKPLEAVVLRAVLQECGEAEVDARCWTVGFIGQPRIGATGQPECLVAIPFRQGIGRDLRHRAHQTAEHGRGGGADQFQRRAE